MYDFIAESTNEVNAYTGEELTVLDSNSFDGWIKIRNARGQEGIVPASYVENIEDDFDNDIPPPPSHYPSSHSASSWTAPSAVSTTPSYINSPPAYSTQDSYVNYNQTSEDQTAARSFTFDKNNASSSSFSSSNQIASTTESVNITSSLLSSSIDLDFFDTKPSTVIGASQVQSSSSSSTISPSSNLFINNASTTSPANTNSFDTNTLIPSIPSTIPSSESFDDSPYAPSSQFNATSNVPSYNQPTPNQQRPYSENKNDSDSDDFDEEDAPSQNNQTINRSGTNQSISGLNAAVVSKHKTKNSYGLETFLLFGPVKSVPDSEKLSFIIFNENRQSVWKRKSPPYCVKILNHTNDKKYHGVKKFVSYEIQADGIPQKVKRRYNHFDWLYKRLEEKYPNICVPPLPDKAVTGNFDEDFINKRQNQLELWLNHLSAHPVIGVSEVFVHFLQCDDASAKWKAGKRKAEKDDYRGAQWFCTLTVPGDSVDTNQAIRDRVDKFAKASINLEYNIKNLSIALDKIGNYHTSSYKKELLILGKRFEDFGTALSAESLDAPNNAALSRAMVTAGNVYTQIGNSYGEQSKEDIGPLLDRFSLYRGIIQQMPDIVQFEKNAIQTYEEFQQRPEKLQGRTLMEVAPRKEMISHVTFAEINQFNKDKVDDITQYMRAFLLNQIKFYTEITDCLKRAYNGFEQIPASPTTTSNINKSLKR